MGRPSKEDKLTPGRVSRGFRVEEGVSEWGSLGSVFSGGKRTVVARRVSRRGLPTRYVKSREGPLLVESPESEQWWILESWKSLPGYGAEGPTGQEERPSPVHSIHRRNGTRVPVRPVPRKVSKSKIVGSHGCPGFLLPSPRRVEWASRVSVVSVPPPAPLTRVPTHVMESRPGWSEGPGT